MERFFDFLVEFFSNNRTLYIIILSLTTLFYLWRIKVEGSYIHYLLFINGNINITFLVILILLTSFTLTRFALWIDLPLLLIRFPVISDIWYALNPECRMVVQYLKRYDLKEIWKDRKKSKNKREFLYFIFQCPHHFMFSDEAKDISLLDFKQYYSGPNRQSFLELHEEIHNDGALVEELVALYVNNIIIKVKSKDITFSGSAFLGNGLKDYLTESQREHTLLEITLHPMAVRWVNRQKWGFFGERWLLLQLLNLLKFKFCFALFFLYSSSIII